jgi:hypothetical protein
MHICSDDYDSDDYDGEGREFDGDALDEHLRRIPDEELSQDPDDVERMIELQVSREREAQRKAEAHQAVLQRKRRAYADMLRAGPRVPPTATDFQAALAPLVAHADPTVCARASEALALVDVIFGTSQGGGDVRDPLDQLMTLALRAWLGAEADLRRLWRPVHRLTANLRGHRRR